MVLGFWGFRVWGCLGFWEGLGLGDSKFRADVETGAHAAGPLEAGQRPSQEVLHRL